MRFLLKTIFLNIPLLISYLVVSYTENPYYFLLAFEFNILFIAGMDNAISVISDSSKNVKSMFIELLEKLDKAGKE